MFKNMIVLLVVGSALAGLTGLPAAAQDRVGQDFTVDGRSYRIEIDDAQETVIFRSGDNVLWKMAFIWPQLTFLKSYVLEDFRVDFYSCSYGDNANNAGTILLAFIFQNGGARATEIASCQTAMTSQKDLLWEDIVTVENREIRFRCGRQDRRHARVSISHGEINVEAVDPPINRPTFAGGAKAGRYVLDECWLKCNLYDDDCRLQEIQGLGLPVRWGIIKNGKVLSSQSSLGQLLIGPFNSIGDARAALQKIPVYAEGKCTNEDFVVQVERVIITVDAAGKITACENENSDMNMCQKVFNRQ